MNSICNCSYPRGSSHRVQLTLEEQTAAEKSFFNYCKPVELYNILRRRSIKHPTFLQRCLDYKLQEKRNTRLTSRNVIFNYKYYNNILQRIEVTKDFLCPFCLVKCASYKGLKFHLKSSHDLFHFDFWANEEYQVVSVSVRTDRCNSEFVEEGADPRKKEFFFCRKPIRPNRQTQTANHAHPFLLDSGLPEGSRHDTSSPDTHDTTSVSSGTSVSFTEQESAPSAPGWNLAPPSMLQFANTRRLSAERSEPRNQALLKRQFFHSHRVQPMALEQVLADEQDSEDEVNDDIADLEDRWRLYDFTDVTQGEKKIMHLWNSFVRKQRVLADSHFPWACEAFSKLHGQDFVRAPTLLCCWRLLMVKLWTHGLIDKRTMDDCNLILQLYQTQSQSQSQGIHPT